MRRKESEEERAQRMKKAHEDYVKFLRQQDERLKRLANEGCDKDGRRINVCWPLDEDPW